MHMKQAIIIGATGLVGSHLLGQVLEDERFSGVTVLTRRSTGINHQKLTEHIVDFADPEGWAKLVKGDVLYLCLGTTRAKAGGKKAQYAVDHTYQYNVAKAAVENNVPAMVLVSSAGADSQSRFFYLRMKGELEEDIQQLDFSKRVFVRPGSLDGPREEKRTMERIGIAGLKTMNKIGLMRNMRPIHAETVARAMVNATFAAPDGNHIYELEEVFTLAVV